MRKILLALLIIVLLLAPRHVEAHADLIGSSPAPGQVLTSFPTTATLEFTEAVAAESASAQLLNVNGEVIATGKTSVDPAASTVLRVQLPTQPDGVYTISWHVISAVDGHPTDGTIAFSVGVNAPRASLLPPPGAPDPATDLPPWGDVVLRWIAYLSLAVALGAAVFAVLAWRPAFRAEAGSPVEWDARARRLLRSLVIYGSIGVATGMLGVLVEQSFVANFSNPDIPVWLSLIQAFGHHEGGYVWIRLLVLPLMALLATLLPAPGSGPARPWWEIVGLGMILALTYSLTSHAAAVESPLMPLAVFDDWLHILAMAAWVGGLLPLGILLLQERQRREKVAAPLLTCATQRFSRLAFICVIVLALTGLVSGLFQVKTIPALLGTRYGQAILVKEFLFAILILLGAVNQLGILPRMGSAGLRAFRQLSRTVRAEWVLAGLLLLAVGGLMSLSPAFQALQADYRAGYRDSYQADGVRLDLRAAPVKVGDNEFGVDVIDRRPGASQAPAVVLLRISAADGSTGVTQVEAKLTSANRYTARGSYFGKLTTWQVEVILRRPGFDDVTHRFLIDMTQIAAGRGDQSELLIPGGEHTH